jgi:hypothetical protein
MDQLLADADDIPNRMRFVFKAEPVGGELKRAPDEHSLQAGWFAREEIAQLDLRVELVERAVEIASDGAALLPLSAFHWVSSEERRREVR